MRKEMCGNIKSDSFGRQCSTYSVAYADIVRHLSDLMCPPKQHAPGEVQLAGGSGVGWSGVVGT